MNLPTDIALQALDAAGITVEMGEIQDGTEQARVILRAYGQCLRQLLRAANWNFARKQAPLVLLADASGNTPNVGTLVPVPWLYEYEYPIDCAKMRFLPWNLANQTPSQPSGNITTPPTPIMTGLASPSYGQRIVPARFTEATDYNYPGVPQPSGAYIVGTPIAITGVSLANPCVITAPAHGFTNGTLFVVSSILGTTQLNTNTYAAAGVTTDTLQVTDSLGNPIDSSAFTTYISGGTIARISPDLPNQASPGNTMQFWNVQGVSPQGRTVILTNVQNAIAVYTAIMLYPSVWDPLFRAGLVSYLASEICLALHKKEDKKLAIAIQDRLIKATKDKITQARLTDGNEGFYSSDIRVDWVDARRSGGANWNGAGLYGLGAGPGYMACGWDACGFADGSAY